MASKRTSKAPRQDRDAKKPRILKKFLLAYTTDWPVLKPSTKVATFCYCCACRLDFSIGHGGCDDCKRHVACKRHKEYAELRRAWPSVFWGPSFLKGLFMGRQVCIPAASFSVVSHGMVCVIVCTPFTGWASAHKTIFLNISVKPRKLKTKSFY